MEAAPIDRQSALSPTWLTHALQREHPGVVVESVEVIHEFTTLAGKYRLALDYAGGSTPGPATVFMKAFLDDAAPRAWIGEPEARFYLDIAPLLDLRMPRALYAAVDPSTRHGIVVLEDLVADDVQFLGALSPYSVDQAADTLAEIAKLHTQTWDAAALDAAWLQPRAGVIDYRTADELQALLDGERGDPLPADLRDANRLRTAVIRLFDLTENDRRCVIHGDAHAGNLYLDRAGRPGILDWQIVRRGHWSFDVAYHLVTALEVSERRRAERELFNRYLDSMRAAGTTMPAFDEAWASYRRALVYGYILWAVTTTVDPRVTNEFVRRLGLAAPDHDSMNMLGV